MDLRELECRDVNWIELYEIRSSHGVNINTLDTDDEPARLRFHNVVNG
jgi:hypothetical protein